MCVDRSIVKKRKKLKEERKEKKEKMRMQKNTTCITWAINNVWVVWSFLFHSTRIVQNVQMCGSAWKHLTWKCHTKVRKKDTKIEEKTCMYIYYLRTLAIATSASGATLEL